MVADGCHLVMLPPLVDGEGGTTSEDDAATDAADNGCGGNDVSRMASWMLLLRIILRKWLVQLGLLISGEIMKKSDE